VDVVAMESGAEGGSIDGKNVPCHWQAQLPHADQDVPNSYCEVKFHGWSYL